MSFALDYPVAAEASVDERARFLRRTFGHLALAVLVFLGLQYALFTFGLARPMTQWMFSGGWLFMLGTIVAFMIVGTLARWWAHHSVSAARQYLGLGLYVVAQAIICVPMLTLAVNFTGDRSILPKAAVLTFAWCGGLATAVAATRGQRLYAGPLVALALCLLVGAALAGIWYTFNLALGLCFLFFVVASGYIIYDASTIVQQYRTDQHVGAALKLFADVALMFLFLIYLLWSISNRED